MREDLLEIPSFLLAEPGKVREWGDMPSPAPARPPSTEPGPSTVKPGPAQRLGLPDGDWFILRDRGWTERVLSAMTRKELRALLNRHPPLRRAGIDGKGYVEPTPRMTQVDRNVAEARLAKVERKG